MANKGNARQGFKALNQRLSAMTKALATTFPQRASADAVRFYKNSFKNQGFTDRGLVKWKEKADPKAKPNRVLRGKTGLLSLSIRPLEVNYQRIVITAGGPHVPYAKIHNEGGVIRGTQSVRAHIRRAHPSRTRSGKRIRKKESNVGAYTRTVNTVIPARPFIGRSHTLKRIIQLTAIKTLQPYLK